MFILLQDCAGVAASSFHSIYLFMSHAAQLTGLQNCPSV